MTYAELVQKIRDYCEVDSNVFTATIVDGFIADTELRILREIDSDNNRKYAQADIVAGQRYVNTPLINDQTLIIRSAQITNVLAPTPDQNYNMQINYILKPEGLSATNTTTYLSTEFPNGLLYASLIEAFGFLKGPMDMVQYYEKRYAEVAKGFSIEQMGRRRRDEYTDGTPRIPQQK